MVMKKVLKSVMAAVADAAKAAPCEAVPLHSAPSRLLLRFWRSQVQGQRGQLLLRSADAVVAAAEVAAVEALRVRLFAAARTACFWNALLHRMAGVLGVRNAFGERDNNLAYYRMRLLEIVVHRGSVYQAAYGNDHVAVTLASCALGVMCDYEVQRRRPRPAKVRDELLRELRHADGGQPLFAYLRRRRAATGGSGNARTAVSAAAAAAVAASGADGDGGGDVGEEEELGAGGASAAVAEPLRRSSRARATVPRWSSTAARRAEGQRAAVAARRKGVATAAVEAAAAEEALEGQGDGGGGGGGDGGGAS